MDPAGKQQEEKRNELVSGLIRFTASWQPRGCPGQGIMPAAVLWHARTGTDELAGVPDTYCSDASAAAGHRAAGVPAVN